MHTRTLFQHADRAAWKPSIPKAFKKGGDSGGAGGQPQRRGRRAEVDAEVCAADGHVRSRSLVTAQRRDNSWERSAGAAAARHARSSTPPGLRRARDSTSESPERDASPPRPSAPSYRGLCYLHQLHAEDLLSTLSLAYDTPRHVLQQVNALPFGSDLDELRADTLLLVPLRADGECVREVIALCDDEEFMKQYADRLTAGFRKRQGDGQRAAQQACPPPAPAAPAALPPASDSAPRQPAAAPAASGGMRPPLQPAQDGNAGDKWSLRSLAKAGARGFDWAVNVVKPKGGASGAGEPLQRSAPQSAAGRAMRGGIRTDMQRRRDAAAGKKSD
eukprot:TRINITY_DN14423_c0_g1_i1.p1 TRINITY_DN14423_c0_g1~~TRINITY_DN14423_c0_g1_i1.p1  ORF type:complete len:361 (+),score=104.10 TRINITY_DN14423_c0_g1_i1:90-1085(+)